MLHRAFKIAAMAFIYIPYIIWLLFKTIFDTAIYIS